MKKVLFLFIILGAILFSVTPTEKVMAAKKRSSKGGLKATEIKEISDKLDTLTKKVYGHSLFSPAENQDLIYVKIKLDNQMLISPDAQLAVLYYKAGMLYKARELKQEAIECFQTILENFSDTALAPRAYKELKAMGVEVQELKKNTEDEEE